MPTITIIDGIKISIYPNEHNPPHLHIDYAEFSCLIEISTQKVIKGQIPIKILIKINEWLVINQLKLLQMFNDLNPNLR